MGRLFGVLVLLLMTGCTCGTSTEGSGSPFQSSSIQVSLEGSSDFSITQTIRLRTGAIMSFLNYTGVCDQVLTDLRFSYRKGNTKLTTEEVLGRDVHFKIYPMAPNESFRRRYSGEHAFTPDAVIFVISDERCA
jgi:hypothetical protein